MPRTGYKAGASACILPALCLSLLYQDRKRSK